MIRLLDFFIAFLGLVFSFPFLIILFIIGLFDTGSPIFRQERVGRNQKPFILVKFRTMKVETASVASHLASSASITPFGSFLRKTKLDEIPQLWNVLKGEMSLVGPRPGLFNQEELTIERSKLNVFDVRPGITGLAQVNQGYDACIEDVRRKVGFDHSYALSLGSFYSWITMDLSIMSKTLIVMIDGRGQ